MNEIELRAKMPSVTEELSPRKPRSMECKMPGKENEGR